MKKRDRITKWLFHHETAAGYWEPLIQLVKPAWRAGFYRAKVVSIESVHADYLELWLEPEAAWPNHVAGQHIELTVELDGRLQTRVFTLACAGNQFAPSRVVRLFIRCHELGRFTSKLLRQLKPKQWVNVSAPKGEFAFETEMQGEQFMVAGGSGITPFLAMLHQYLPIYDKPIVLFHIAKSGAHIVAKELASLAARYSHFRYELLTRNELAIIETSMLAYQPSAIYCCGPAGLMQHVKHLAQRIEARFVQESFGLFAFTLGEAAANHRVVFSDKALLVNNQQSLLNQFEQAQLPVVRGCGMGICHQCQCVKKQGVVRDIRTGEISDSGESLIQLCVSQAVSDLELVP
ncbi:Flavodoxin reductases (ferredoxin-NADPH reductases) family 1 [Pseudoalteromonas luteoviolacea B = ATCC 29581]|nr:Flavodoxin reductases (ferredoxin-NADPH reductases) family 1 [Pseudoalteromonas luteoviolacea B = ATCC 29581]